MLSFVLASLILLSMAVETLSSAGNIEDAIPHSKPWTVAIKVENKRNCKGVLINRKASVFETNVEEGSSDVILTAGHCLRYWEFRKEQQPRIYYYAYFGKHNISIDEPWQVRRRIVARMVHSNFSYDKERMIVHNDISMLLLDSPVQFTSRIKPISLSSYPVDEVTNCSVSAWTGSENNGLKNVNLAKIYTSVGRIAAEKVSKSTPNKADSGSDLVCYKGSTPVLQGIISEIPETKLYFANIVDSLGWISQAFDQIRDHEFGDEYEYMASLDSPASANNWPAVAHVDYFLKMMRLNPFYLRDLRMEPVTKESNFTLITFIRLHKDEFYLNDLAYYSSVENTHMCATMCYQYNRNGVCNYSPATKHCYYSRSNFNLQYSVYIKGCVAISFDVVRKNRDTTTKLFDQRQPSKLGMFWPQWNVSIQYGEKPLECIGQVVHKKSPNEGVLFEIQAMGSCLRKLGEGSLNFDASVLIMIHSKKLISKIDLPVQYSKKVGNSEFRFEILNDSTLFTEYPVVRTYQPTRGSFFSAPCSIPWFGRFTKRPKKSHCIVALLKESDFHQSGRRDRTKFVLTTVDCALDVIEKSHKATTVQVGSNFCSTTRDSLQSRRIKMVHTKSYIDLDVGLTSDKISLLELSQDIFFDNFTRPISFFNGSIDRLLRSNLFSTGFDTPNGFEVGTTLNIIPLTLAQQSVHESQSLSNIPDQISTKRAYLKADSIPSESGKPLITCDESLTNCHLLGFSDHVMKSHGNVVEIQNTVQFYAKWISKVIAGDTDNMYLITH